MRILVTGATGLVGSHTVRELLSAGHEVRAMVRSMEKAHRVFADLGEPPEYTIGDIGDRAACEAAVAGCDAVVHAAAVVAIEGASEEQLIETNVGGVRNMLEAAVDAGIDRIVHVSSLSAIFDPSRTDISADSEPHESEHAYGRSKAMAEHWVRDQQAAGRPIKITYPPAIVAPDDPGMTESTNALRIFASRLLPLTSGGFQMIDARDLAVAHRLLIEAAPGPGRYITGGHFLPWAEFGRVMKAAGGYALRLPIPGWVLRGSGVVCDALRRVVPVGIPVSVESMAYATRWFAIPTTEALTELGMAHRPAEQTMRETIAWLRSAGHIR